MTDAGVPQTFSLQSVTERMKWRGADTGAEVPFHAFLAEQDLSPRGGESEKAHDAMLRC
jgi:hypothetical protein